MDGTTPQLLLAAPKAMKAETVENQPKEQPITGMERLKNFGLDYGKEFQWQKGQSGNPKGRPPGKSMKEFTREFLWNMSEDARTIFLQSLSPEMIWKMAEGNPHQSQDVQMSGVVTHQVIGMQIQKEIPKPINAKLSQPTT